MDLEVEIISHNTQVKQNLESSAILFKISILECTLSFIRVLNRVLDYRIIFQIYVIENVAYLKCSIMYI